MDEPAPALPSLAEATTDRNKTFQRGGMSQSDAIAIDDDSGPSSQAGPSTPRKPGKLLYLPDFMSDRFRNHSYERTLTARDCSDEQGSIQECVQ
jgi:hypothetical protein